MALIRDGGLMGQLSGRVGPNVFAHNRYGSYVRAGTIPVTSTTVYAVNAKAILSAASQAWRGLTAAQRLQWKHFAENTPAWNRIGQRITLTGQAAYVGIYTRMVHDGLTPLAVPPITDPPAALTSLSLSPDIGIGNFDLTFAATPTGADVKLWLTACVLDSTAINYVGNRLRWIGTTGTAQASPYDPQAQIESRFGTLQLGQRVVIMAAPYDTTSGLLGAPLRADATVIST